jgi:sterol desaturase/sphingolipid hydroxylase (fatty acid hydroxylase superfamily)
MIGIPLGLLYANASEWLIHKHVLHGTGRKKGSFFRFHWVEHHREVRLHDMVDHDYERSVFGTHAQGKEALCLAAAAVAHLPLFPVAPFFTGTVLYSIANYYVKHRRSHLDPEWAKEHLPWHYDHHMAPDQDANWCVTRPWFDHVMGTRKKWLGTEAQKADEARKAKRRAERAAAAATAPAAAVHAAITEPALAEPALAAAS